MSMPSSEYNQFLAAIKAANDTGDREVLRKIQMQLISKYGPDDNDAHYLINQFRYNV